MIRFEHTEVCGWKAAIRGMRNPMNSWDKSDSGLGCDEYPNESCRSCGIHDDSYSWCPGNKYFKLGPNDLNLMQNLCNAGTDHRKFMRMLTVYVDITAPLYWWKEFDTYKVGTVANSCSTMHKIHAKEFTLGDFSMEHLYSDELDFFKELVDRLNGVRELYLESKKKEDWWQMIQLLPSSYNQKRTIMLNYEVLRNMYHARKNHKLDEWHDFCDWINTLPYAEELIIGEKE